MPRPSGRRRALLLLQGNTAPAVQSCIAGRLFLCFYCSMVIEVSCSGDGVQVKLGNLSIVARPYCCLTDSRSHRRRTSMSLVYGDEPAAMRSGNRLSAMGEPKPVTGSQPGAAL